MRVSAPQDALGSLPMCLAYRVLTHSIARAGVAMSGCDRAYQLQVRLDPFVLVIGQVQEILYPDIAVGDVGIVRLELAPLISGGKKSEKKKKKVWKNLETEKGCVHGHLDHVGPLALFDDKSDVLVPVSPAFPLPGHARAKRVCAKGDDHKRVHVQVKLHHAH